MLKYAQKKICGKLYFTAIEPAAIFCLGVLLYWQTTDFFYLPDTVVAAIGGRVFSCCPGNIRNKCNNLKHANKN